MIRDGEELAAVVTRELRSRVRDTALTGQLTERFLSRS
jgi:hypothetical protein